MTTDHALLSSGECLRGDLAGHHPPREFLDECAARRAAVDSALDRWLPRPPACPPRLAEAMRYAMLSGGKRVRPLLTLLACAACEGDEGDALAPACAVELVHGYSLVHDDLPALDDDDLRRGQPTVHRAFGEATAILAGDGLLTLAFELLGREIAAPAISAACVRELAAAAGAAGMVGGQVDDLDGLAEAERNPRAAERLEAIHVRKTGALLLASARLGAIAAGADESARYAIDEYGRRVGLVFQIVDDVLDLEQDNQAVAEFVRNPNVSAPVCPTPNFAALLGLDAARRRAEQLVDEACAALRPLGAAAECLAEMAQFLLRRTE